MVTNIWILGTPEETAKALDDRSLDKQIKAIAQTLCSVHWSHAKEAYLPNCNGDTEYKFNTDRIPLNPKNFTDEFTQWTGTCRANYSKLVDMGIEACKEAEYRYMHKSYFGKPLKHKLQPVIEWCKSNCPELPDSSITSFPITIPVDYWVAEDPFPVCDLVASHKKYYRAKLPPENLTCTYKNFCPNAKNGLHNNIPHSYRNPKAPTWTRRPIPCWLILETE